MAEKRAKTLEHASGDKREDPYYWLRDDDRKDEAVLAYIKVCGLRLQGYVLCLAQHRPQHSSLCLCCRPRTSTQLRSWATPRSCRSSWWPRCEAASRRQMRLPPSGVLVASCMTDGAHQQLPALSIA